MWAVVVALCVCLPVVTWDLGMLKRSHSWLRDWTCRMGVGPVPGKWGHWLRVLSWSCLAWKADCGAGRVHPDLGRSHCPNGDDVSVADRGEADRTRHSHRPLTVLKDMCWWPES